MFKRVLLCAALFATASFATQDYGYYTKNAQNGKTSAFNEGKRFAMHSVMKFPQALYVAYYLDSAKININAQVLVKKADLMQDTWSPMMKEMGDSAMISYADLLKWALVQSDNNASDLLFKFCGAPEKITQYINKLGFKDIQIGSTEAEMHAELAKSDLNWCTPKDMVNLFQWFYKNKNGNANLKFIWKTMSEVETGKDRIPAAVPAGSTVVHKTGTGFPPKDKLPPMNDAGIAILPNGQVQFIAIFVPEPTSPTQLADTVRKAILGK